MGNRLDTPQLQSTRKGFMSHVPLVDDLVDFKRLNDPNKTKTRFYLNAFSRPTEAPADLRQLGQAGLSTSTMAPRRCTCCSRPSRSTSDLLMTGATRDPTGLQAIWIKERDLWAVLALDPQPDAFGARRPTPTMRSSSC